MMLQRAIWLIGYYMCSFYNLETVNNEEQKKYLIKKVLPFLEINDKLYLKILEEELELLCDNGKDIKQSMIIMYMYGKNR